MKKRILVTMLALLLVSVFGLQSAAFAQEAGQLDMELVTPELKVLAEQAPVTIEADEPEAILQAVVPGSISGLKAVGASSSSIKLTWKKATNAYKYLIYRSSTKSGGYRLIRKQRSVSYTDTGLSSGARYYYKVIPYTQNNAKGKTAGPVSAVAQNTVSLNGGWLATEIDDIYRHMYVFNGSKVSHYRVDSYGGDSWIGRDWGAYPLVSNGDGSYNIIFDGFSGRVKFINDNTIEIKKDGESAERFSRISSSYLSSLLATLY